MACRRGPALDGRILASEAECVGPATASPPKDTDTDELSLPTADPAVGETRPETVPAKREPFPSVGAAVDAIVRRVAALPVLDGRTAEQIIGYNENGLSF